MAVRGIPLVSVGQFMKIAAAVLIVLAFRGAFAQDAFDKHASNMALLQTKPIQRELGVTEAQRAKMNAAAAVYNKQMSAVAADMQKAASSGKKPPADVKKRADSALAALNNSVISQLTPTQLKRLREISLQAAGAASLADDQVGKRVGLSPDQIKKIRSIYEAAIKKAAALEEKAVDAAIGDLKKKTPKSDAEAKKLYEEAQKRAQAARQKAAPQSNKIRIQAEVDAMKLLTPQQKAAWIMLIGKKYTMPTK